MDTSQPLPLILPMSTVPSVVKEAIIIAIKLKPHSSLLVLFLKHAWAWTPKQTAGGMHRVSFRSPRELELLSSSRLSVSE